ncbi:hypothetical protein MASR2M78_09820 [Treponema sp.]
MDNHVPLGMARRIPRPGASARSRFPKTWSPVLQQLKDIAARLKLDGPENYVLMGAKPDVPINAITIARGYRRVSCDRHLR